MTSDESPPLALPGALRDLAESLEARGHDAWIVGETLHDLLRGAPPASYAMATSATPEQIAAALPAAVATAPDGSCFTLPTPAGPVDLSSHRNGPRIEDDLAHRDFTVLALAYSPSAGRLLDPHDGTRHLGTRRLRAVGDAGRRLAEDPLRALRAARLVACHEYAADADLERALCELPAAALEALPAAALRRELVAMLLGPRAGAGLALLRRTGLEVALAGGTRPDAASLIDALPVDLAPRLAAWLRGAGAGRALRRLRFTRELGDRVLRLLQHHPIDRTTASRRTASLRRLLTRLDDADRRSLLELRAREIEVAAARGDRPEGQLASDRASLEEFERALTRCAEQLQRDRRATALALDGQQVMATLAIGPGPRVGRALRFLREQAAANPALNTPDTLRGLLREWRANVD